MGRGRKKKLLIIIILVVAVTGLSIGLATFSNILTISSSATVKPNDGEYKVTIYGWKVDPETITDFQSQQELFSKYASPSYSVPSIPSIQYTNTIASPAIIDNNTYTISNISVTLTPGISTDFSAAGAAYDFMIVNEGAYDVFMDPNELKSLINDFRAQTCKAVDPTKQAQVDQYCDKVFELISVGDISFSDTLGYTFIPISESDIDSMEALNLSPGNYVFIRVSIAFFSETSFIAETGEFSIQFEDIALPFGSTAMYVE